MERVYYLSADKQQAIEIAESKVASLGDNVSRKRSDPATALYKEGPAYIYSYLKDDNRILS